jgi:hypothetical protein
MNRVPTIAFLVILGSLTGAAVLADEKASSDESSLISTNVSPPRDVFTLPIQSIVEILNHGATASPAGQVRVQGVVQANSGRTVVLIRDRTGGIPIESSRTNDLKSGLWVDVVGSPIQRGAAFALTDVTFRRIGIAASNQLVLTNSAASSAKVLTTVQQIRTLTPEDAALGHPVRVRCVVLGDDAGSGGTLFVQTARLAFMCLPMVKRLTLIWDNGSTWKGDRSGDFVRLSAARGFNSSAELRCLAVGILRRNYSQKQGQPVASSGRHRALRRIEGLT